MSNANCVYLNCYYSCCNIAGLCPTSSSKPSFYLGQCFYYYYYYNYNWIYYTVSAVVFVIIVGTILGCLRRRRLRRRLQQ